MRILLIIVFLSMITWMIGSYDGGATARCMSEKRSDGFYVFSAERACR